MKKILIVDDELDMRIFLSAVFETSGYQSMVARDGTAGLQKAREIAPDLIVLDVMMPGKGGVNMYRELREDVLFKDTPILMLSAVSEESFLDYLKMVNVQLEASIALPNAYLEKPPEPDDVLETTRRLIGNP